VTPITLHGGRHSYAELALGAGVRLHVVSRQLGHRSISTTADIYTHDNDSATVEVLGGIRRPSVLPLAAARDERCWAGSVGGGI
jgi:integrase